MIAPPPGVHVWLACGVTDMRKGFDGLASLAQQQLGKIRSVASCSCSAAVAAIW